MYPAYCENRSIIHSYEKNNAYLQNLSE